MGLPETLRTRRRLLTRFVEKDAGNLAGMHRDPRFAQALGVARTDAEIERLTQDVAGHWDAHGFGWWALWKPESERFIGYGGLRSIEIGSRHEIELAFGLVPECWGRGLATELVCVAVARGIVRLGIAELLSFTLPCNEASRRVVENAGFTYDRDIVHAGRPHALYRLCAREWRTAVVKSRFSARTAAAKQSVAA